MNDFLQSAVPTWKVGSVMKLYRTIQDRTPFRTVSLQHDDHLYTESVFRTLLVHERMRTERTKRPFYLARISIGTTLGSAECKVVATRVAEQLNGVIRETDLIGRICGGREIGVVMTDVNQASAEMMTSKLRCEIEAVLSVEQCNAVSLNGALFPGEKGTMLCGNGALNALLYERCGCGRLSGAVAAVCKRSIDIVGSIAFIIMFSPLFIVIPLLVKFCSKGPAFFAQERIGRLGTPFTCLKFRTMEQSNDNAVHKDFVKQFIAGNGAEQTGDQGPVYKLANDPRVTSIGRFLRKSSLDELPQFFNVLLGHMSLVGPRPAIVYEVEAYDLWHRRRVFEVKPGITGVWQLKGRSRTDFNSMVRMDINYINTWSPMLDLQLIATTPIALVSAKGAC